MRCVRRNSDETADLWLANPLDTEVRSVERAYADGLIARAGLERAWARAGLSWRDRIESDVALLPRWNTDAADAGGEDHRLVPSRRPLSREQRIERRWDLPWDHMDLVFPLLGGAEVRARPHGDDAERAAYFRILAFTAQPSSIYEKPAHWVIAPSHAVSMAVADVIQRRAEWGRAPSRNPSGDEDRRRAARGSPDPGSLARARLIADAVRHEDDESLRALFSREEAVVLCATRFWSTSLGLGHYGTYGTQMTLPTLRSGIMHVARRQGVMAPEFHATVNRLARDGLVFASSEWSGRRPSLSLTPLGLHVSGLLCRGLELPPWDWRKTFPDAVT